MTKKMRRLITAMLAVVMVFAMGITAFAADTTANLKVNDTKGNNTFTYYKVMDAKSLGGDKYEYTVAKDFENFFKAPGYTLNKQNEILNPDGDKITTDGLSNVKGTEASKLASALEDYAKANGINGTTLPKEGADLAKGYYLISETASVDDQTVLTKPVLVDLVSDKEVTPKDSTTTLEKKIVENNKKVDANNVSIGDDVDYEVTSSIPVYKDNVDQNKLTFEFEDTFSEGLTYNNDMVVTIGDKTAKLTDDYTVTVTGQKVVIALTKKAIFDNQGKAVKLNYSAELNDKAKVDSTDGNPNTVKLKYTNNTNVNDSYGYLNDEVKTFTYGFKIKKVDPKDDTADMSGAEFTIKDATGKVVGKFTYNEKGQIKASDGKIVIGDDGYATIKGLDAGTYTVEETVAPKDYAMLSSAVTVVIKDEGEEAGGEPNGIAQITASGAGNAAVDGQVKDNGNGVIDLTVKIENIKGVSLPETGAKTAMYFMLIGGAMVLLAGAFFGIAKKLD